MSVKIYDPASMKIILPILELMTFWKLLVSSVFPSPEYMLESRYGEVAVGTKPFASVFMFTNCEIGNDSYCGFGLET